MFYWLNDLNKGGYYLFLCIITIIIAYASNHFLATDELYYASYAEQFTIEQIQSIIATANDSVWHYLGYLLIPIVIIVRVLFTTFCLQIGNLVQEYHTVFLKIIFQLSFVKSILFVLLTYCAGNYLYIVALTFIHLNFS